MATTESLLSDLTARWTGEGDLGNVVAKLQYTISEPLEDGATGVKVTFGSTIVAEVGQHAEAADMVIYLSGKTFEALAKDELWLNKFKDLNQLRYSIRTNRGRVLARRLVDSHARRP